MAEGKIVYHGPCSQALQFFKDCGFWCPERKGVADFLQEITSKKDQRQYWYRTDIPYSYVSVDEFSQIFKTSYWGRMLVDELSQPYDKSQSHESSLSYSKYSLGKWDLFEACMKREILLMKRNSFIYIFKTVQLTITATITMTVFLRRQLDVDLLGSNYLLGSLYYTLVRLMTNGVAELIMTITRLPVVYKQKALYLYPAWAYCLPAAILKIPFSVLDSLVWTSITYYVIGYSPEITRFLRQFLLLIALHMSSTSMCRSLAAVFKTDVAATTVGSLVLVLMFLFGGFILPRPSLPKWLRWGFWLSPMSYGEIGITLNEFLAPRWQKIQEGNITVGREVLKSRGLDFDSNFFWISIAALLGFAVVFDILFVVALTYLKEMVEKEESDTEAFKVFFGKECPGRVRCYGRNITKTSLKRKTEINALKQAHSEEVSTLRDEFQDNIDRLQNAFKTVIQQCNPQINIESIEDLLGLSHGDANSSPKDIRPQMHSSTSTHAPCHGKQCINEDVEKDDINDEIQEDDINDKIQEDDLNDKIQEDDVDDEFQEDDIDLDDEFQEEDIDGEFQEDDVDEEFMEDDISNEFQEDDLDALLLEDKLE
ncbi:unnamed protein product [Vicia faba]|uniref:Uncharacterized protein n=1 Tax=Vicia faba TaxID=3906 RepID=A0AAV0Z5H6_VICFA|nr:unnamed protein product [Vicia faba]